MLQKLMGRRVVMSVRRPGWSGSGEQRVKITGRLTDYDATLGFVEVTDDSSVAAMFNLAYVEVIGAEER